MCRVWLLCLIWSIMDNRLTKNLLVTCEWKVIIVSHDLYKLKHAMVRTVWILPKCGTNQFVPFETFIKYSFFNAYSICEFLRLWQILINLGLGFLNPIFHFMCESRICLFAICLSYLAYLNWEAYSCSNIHMWCIVSDMFGNSWLRCPKKIPEKLSNYSWHHSMHVLWSAQ